MGGGCERWRASLRCQERRLADLDAKEDHRGAFRGCVEDGSDLWNDHAELVLGKDVALLGGLFHIELRHRVTEGLRILLRHHQRNPHDL